MTIATHFWFRLRRDHVIAPTPEARRLVSRTILRLDHRRRLLAHGLADTHGHGLRLGGPAEARDLARRIEHSLKRQLRLPVGFGEVDWEPVENVWHLNRSFWYVLDQCRHHKLDWDPAFESTNLPDLLGMRPWGAYAQGLLRQQLPRVRRCDLLRFLGAPGLAPAVGPAEGVVLATERALALPVLRGSRREVIRGRRAALEVLGASVGPSQASRILGISRASVYRLQKRPVEGALVKAIQGQLGLIAALSGPSRVSESTVGRRRAEK